MCILLLYVGSEKKKVAKLNDDLKNLNATAEASPNAWNINQNKLTERDTPEYLSRMIKLKEKDLEIEKRRLEREVHASARNFDEYVEHAKRDMERKRSHLKRKREEALTAEKNKEVTMKSIKVLSNKRGKLLRHATKHSNHAFNRMQQINQQSGRLNIDHRTKTLQETVTLKSQSVETSQATEMSGGERSYLTLTLLLALSNNINSPFQIMDEFDVFMDEMSRERSMHILVKSAMALKERQFILVTPLGLEALQRNCKAWIGADVGEDGGIDCD